MNRRLLLTSSLALGVAAAVGCTASPPTTTPTPSTSGSPVMPDAARTLLAYFSRAGENYYYGGRRLLDVGNTQVLAEMIAGQLDVPAYPIEAADPYSEDYNATVARNVREQEADSRPAIANAVPNLDDFDTIVVGSPIWNVQPPMIMATFTESFDLAGKRVIPFTTHAMSGLGRAVEFYTNSSPGATMGEGLAVRGEEVAQAEPAVRDWLRRAGLLN